MYHVFFIHSSVDGHLGCFHVLAIVNSAKQLLFKSWSVLANTAAKGRCFVMHDLHSEFQAVLDSGWKRKGIYR